MGTTSNISSSSSRINNMLGLGDTTPIIHDTNKSYESPQTPGLAGVYTVLRNLNTAVTRTLRSSYPGKDP